MVRNILIISLIVLLATSACQASGVAAELPAEDVAVEAQVDLGDLPDDLLVPSTLPGSIEDPLLMKSWIALYNRQETVALWDGVTVSGKQLAQYVIDHAVVITWNTSSEHPRSSWVDRSGSGVIYITMEAKTQEEGQMTRLVTTLAHELFHLTLPFGQTEDTLYEEYWAFYVGANVSGRGQASFYYTNPLSIASLEAWFRTYGLPGYLETHPTYPANVIPVN